LKLVGERKEFRCDIRRFATHHDPHRLKGTQGFLQQRAALGHRLAGMRIGLGAASGQHQGGTHQ